MFKNACPILPSVDFEQTKPFYGLLGFSVASEYREQGYLTLVRDGVEIHFFKSPAHVAKESDHGVCIRVKDANQLSREFARRAFPREGMPRLVEAEAKPWGVCELVVVDTDENLLRIGRLPEK